MVGVILRDTEVEACETGHLIGEGFTPLFPRSSGQRTEFMALGMVQTYFTVWALSPHFPSSTARHRAGWSWGAGALWSER